MYLSVIKGLSPLGGSSGASASTTVYTADSTDITADTIDVTADSYTEPIE